jgi:calcineurin-like phosphoesterase family protein
MKRFFTADTHFRHSNIIKYSNRPFPNVKAMDETLIKNWNELVGPKDEVFHLGDLVFGYEEDIFRILRALNGNIFFIFGNHDKELRRFEKRWRGVNIPELTGRVSFLGDYREIKIEGQSITLSHYAFKVWNKSHHGAWNLYGHSHGSLPDDPNSLQIDVGVDCHNYRPISFEEVKGIMTKKTFKPIDHHG